MEKYIDRMLIKEERVKLTVDANFGLIEPHQCRVTVMDIRDVGNNVEKMKKIIHPPNF